jgi:serine/threonine protein kinase
MEGNFEEYILYNNNYVTSNKVYKATHFGKDVIIKILDYYPYEELEMLSKLKPVCEYFLCLESFGKIKGKNSYFISTEFIKGITLSEYLKKPHNKEHITDIMKNVIKSIKELHKLGIVHNDINSENIIITENNKIRIIDFGEANENKKYMYNDFLQLQRIFNDYTDTKLIIDIMNKI